MRRALVVVCVGLLASACRSSHHGGSSPEKTGIVIDSPGAGAELLASENPAITVSGTVTSPVDVDALELWVNGEPAALGADGAFTVDLVPRVGVNHVEVEVYENPLSPPVTRELDVLWGPSYLPALAGTTGFDLPSAVELRLGQRLFDSRLLGSDLDLTADPVVADDLASMVELVLRHADLASLTPGSLQLGSGDTTLDLTIPAVTPGDVVVDAAILSDTEQGMDLFIDMTGVYVGMDGQLAVAGNTWTVAGGIATDMYAFARVTMTVTTSGVVATVSDAQATLGPLTPMFTGTDGPELNAFVTLGEHDLRTLLQGLVADQLIPAFTGALPGLFESVLGGLDATLSDASFQVDSGLGEPVSLTLSGTMGGVDVLAGPPDGAEPGHMTVRDDVSVRTTGAPLHPGSRGALQLDPLADPPFSDGTGLNLAVRMDLVNALLHALWNGGLLEGHLDLLGISADVSAKLPPVVRDVPMDVTCYVNGERCDLLLEIGQLEVDFPDQSQHFVIDVTVGAKIVVGVNGVALALQDTPDVHVWDESPGPGPFDTEFVHDTIVNLVWPPLASGIQDNLSIALPIPSLADLGLIDVAPDLQNATLGLRVQQAGIESGYLRLAGDLTLVAPQAP